MIGVAVKGKKRWVLRWPTLIVLQAMDTGGKDGTIRHIFTRVNPQGVDVTPFKVPTPLEDSLGNMQVIEGLFRSAVENSWVSV